MLIDRCDYFIHPRSADTFITYSYYNLNLTERLLISLKAGLLAGGEEGDVHSAGIKVIHNNTWPLVDLRVDWLEDNPIEELYKIWKNYEPQMKDYQSRALNPDQAPTYGVPGDL